MEDPIGLLSRTYVLPISWATRRAVMDAIARLTTHDRLSLERDVIDDPDKFIRAATEAQNIDRAYFENELDSLWSELTFSMWKEGRIRGRYKNKDVSALESVWEYRKHKEEQKARILQGMMRANTQHDKEAWRAVQIVIDMGHRSVNAKALQYIEREEIQKKEQLILHAITHLVHDQSMLVQDILKMWREDGFDSDDTHSLDLLMQSHGIASSAHFLDYINDTEDELSAHAVVRNFSQVIKVRMEQYAIIDALAQHTVDTPFQHLAHAYFESLRVLLDAAGALYIVQAEIEKKDALHVFQQGIRVAISTPIEDGRSTNFVRLLRGVQLCADDLISSMYAAHISFDVNDDVDLEQYYDNILESITLSLPHQADDAFLLSDLRNIINSSFEEPLNTLRTEKLLGNHLRAVSIATLISLRELFFDHLNAFAQKKGRGYIVDRNFFEMMLQRSEDAIDHYRNILQKAGDAFFQLLTDRNEQVAHFSEASIVSLHNLSDTFGYAMSGAEDWQQDLSLAFAHVDEMTSGDILRDKELRTQYNIFKGSFFAQPFVLFARHIRSRWISDRPYHAYPLHERLQEYRATADLYNIALAKLEAGQIGLPAVEAHKGGFEGIAVMVSSLDALYRVIIPRIQEQMQESLDISNLLENNDDNDVVIGDLTKELFMAYDEQNLQKIREMAEDGTISLMQSERLIEIIVHQEEIHQTAALTFLNHLMG